MPKIRHGVMVLLLCLLGAMPAPAQRKWELRQPGVSPPARGDTALVYDAARARSVLFGGRAVSNTVATLTDTWLWDGASWTKASSATAPPARIDHALAYDSARHRVVLFGGAPSHLFPPTADTWEWDGTNWAQVSPVSSPAARSGHAMAYDEGRRRLVLFGGETKAHELADSGPVSETWEYDGVTWTQIASQTAPPAQEDRFRLAYDGKRRKTLRFGGRINDVAIPDTWSWDGVNWTKESPASSPPARKKHGMARDDARDRVVVFGGTGNGQPLPDDPETSFEDTWEWNGSSWAQATLSQPQPAGRDQHGMTYDLARSCIVLFGGFGQTEGPRNDTFELSSREPGNATPTGSAGTSLTVITGTAVQLAATGADTDNDLLTYSWYRTGGTGPSAESTGLESRQLGFTPVTAGTYTFTVSVRDGRGGIARDSVTITATASETCPGSQQRSVDVVAGLNLLAVPLMPCGREYTAQHLLLAADSPFVARTSGDGRFEVYLPGLSTKAWTIDGAHGYLVRRRLAGRLDFRGEFWP